MSLPLVFSHVFEPSVEEAFDWYRSQSEFAAMHLLSKIDEAIKLLVQNPRLFPVQKRQFRQVVLTPFPYVLVYKVRQHDVFIYKLFHTSRNPRQKLK
jgi:plasmid stabilization system protein ParE